VLRWTRSAWMKVVHARPGAGWAARGVGRTARLAGRLATGAYDDRFHCAARVSHGGREALRVVNVGAAHVRPLAVMCRGLEMAAWVDDLNFFAAWRLVRRPSATSATGLEYCCLGAGACGAGNSEGRGGGGGVSRCLVVAQLAAPTPRDGCRSYIRRRDIAVVRTIHHMRNVRSNHGPMLTHAAQHHAKPTAGSICAPSTLAVAMRQAPRSVQACHITPNRRGTPQ
jgi:hypothetical protein